MRRCYRSVALVLGGILLTSNTFSDSCSFPFLNAYAAEDTWSPTETVLPSDAANAFLEQPIPLLDLTRGFSKINIQTEEENVETELPEEAITEPEIVTEENTNHLDLDANDYHVLLKIVESESGCEDLTGRILVANVILNRVRSDLFPNTVTEVVYQKHRGVPQFSPTTDGRIEQVTVSADTVTAVDRALQGEDPSMGALYFRSVHCDSRWHDNHLVRILEHGNHIFYIP